MNEKNPLLTFFIGAAMLGAGLYWLFNSVQVEAFTFGAFRFGATSFNIPSGMVIVPLLLGVFWWIMKPDSIMPKILTVVGVIIIVASIIGSVRLRFIDRSLYEYTIMLLMIVGGAGLLARVLLVGNDNNKKNETNNQNSSNEYDKYMK